MNVVSAGANSSGESNFALHEFDVSFAEYGAGEHYQLASDALSDDGFAEPFVHFDEFEVPALLIPGVQQYLGIEADSADPSIVIPSETLKCPA